MFNILLRCTNGNEDQLSYYANSSHGFFFYEIDINI